MNGLSRMMTAAAVASGLAACGQIPDAEDLRRYEVATEGAWRTTRNGSAVETAGSLMVGEQRVGLTIRSDQAKGPGSVTVESLTHRGEKITLQHDMLQRALTVTVGDRGRFVVEQTPNGLYRFQNNSYKDDRTERRDLAREVADYLLDRSVEDQSMVAQGVATRALLGADQQVASAHGVDASKLFLAFVFADLQAEIESNLGIQVGQNNWQDFGDE